MQKTCVSVNKDGSYRVEKASIDHRYPNEYSAKAANGQLDPEKIRELTSALNSQEIAASKQRATLYIGPGFTDGEYALVFIVRGKTVQVLSHANTFGILGSVDGTVRIVEKPQKEYKSLLDWVRANAEKQKLKFERVKESECAQPQRAGNVQAAKAP
jgi:acylphosphatase